ncbi:MAG: ornithine carbamoyltransferase [Candidatus Helarchaeota archaeon]
MLNFNTKDLLTVTDLTKKEILQLMELTKDIKKNWFHYIKYLEYRRLGLLFEKPSTRTRVSFEVGIKELGGYSIFLKFEEMQLIRGESLIDTAKTLERYLDYLIIRTSNHLNLKIFAENSRIPVINALSDLFHPCQALTDVFTIFEKKKDIKKIAYIGDENNVCNSLMLVSSMLGLNLNVATPRNYEPNDLIQEKCKNVLISNDPKQAAKEADVIYTDTWISSHEKISTEKIEALKPFQVNKDLVDLARDDFIFMHCLPAYRSREVTLEVMESENSIVYDQAENRLHVQKGILIGLKMEGFRGYQIWF